MRARRSHRVLVAAAIAASGLVTAAWSQELPVLGVTGAHDPSTITKEGSTYFYYTTGQGIVARTSTDGTNWNNGTAVFSTQPAWTTTAVPGFTGFFWAPDVILRNNQYYMYYAISTFGSKVSAIGLATSPTLNPADANYGWTDQGAVIQSNNNSAWNAIDPSLLQDTTGNLFMSFGSYSNGIYLAQLDPTTGKIKSGTTQTRIAANSQNNANGYFNGIEASYLLKHDGFYYLFDNWGGCCSGINSTYNIRVGRATSIAGPYLDENGVPLTSNGGTLFLGNDGNQIGPGQFSFFNNGTQDEFGYHYYDGNANGAPTEGLRDLFWTANDWPTIAPVNPTWTGPTTANWSTAANWSDTLPNAAGNIANFVTTSGTSPYTVTLDGGAKTVATVNFNSNAAFTIGAAAGNGLILDTGNSDNVTLNVQLGSHSILAPITAKESLGVNVTQAASTLTLGAVSGSTLNKYGFGTLGLSGTNAYSANVFVRAGTLDVTGAVTAGSFSSIGVGASDVGTLNVRLSGSFTATGDLNVGDSGDSNTAATGTLNLSGSAQVTINAGGGFYVGSGFFSGSKANGTVFQSGGTLTANGTTDGGFTIGGRTSSAAIGIYNLSAGNVNANTNVWAGGHGTGTMNQTGGTFTASEFVSIGRWSGATGIWNISNGSLSQTNAADSVIVGEAGTGTLNISSLGQVTTASALKIGLSGGTGTVNLNGGTLSTTAIQKGTGAANLNFAGGTLKPEANASGFIPVGTTATVKTGGAIIDSSGFNVTISAPLVHDSTLGATADGGLTKNGLGTLTLAGANSYTGPTTINAGGLTLANSASITGSTPIGISASGILNAQGASNDGLANNAALNVSGSAIFAAGAQNGTIKPLTLSSLTLNTGGTAQVAPPPSHADRQVLVLTSGLALGKVGNNWQGQLDLTGNDMIVEGGSLGDVSSQLDSGFTGNGGYWNGTTGIVSSTASADSRFLTTLGSRAGGSPFDGVSTSPSDVLVKYTYFGDADLNGTVNGADYQQIDNGFGNALTGWSNGDFNYDGVVNGSDFALIDNVFNQLSATGASSLAIVADTTNLQIGANTSAVPEPSTAGALLVGALGVLGRRAKKNTIRIADRRN